MLEYTIDDIRKDNQQMVLGKLGRRKENELDDLSQK